MVLTSKSRDCGMMAPSLYHWTLGAGCPPTVVVMWSPSPSSQTISSRGVRVGAFSTIWGTITWSFASIFNWGQAKKVLSDTNNWENGKSWGFHNLDDYHKQFHNRNSQVNIKHILRVKQWYLIEYSWRQPTDLSNRIAGNASVSAFVFWECLCDTQGKDTSILRHLEELALLDRFASF